jgi:sugar phosphate isomerase/epimerase
MSAITRREFIGSAGATVVALGGAAVSATEPITRPGKPSFKLSMAAYSMRQYLTAAPGSAGAMDLGGFVDFCAKLGLDGAELTAYYFPKPVTRPYLNELKRRAHFAGLSISGGAIGNDFCVPPGPKLDAQLEQAKQWFDHYADLGAPVIRVFAGSVPKGENEETAVARCIGILEQACEEAGKRGLVLALENHGGVTATAELCLRIVKAVKSPWFGVNLDSGNFRDGDDPYEELARIAPYAVNAQIKVEVYRRRKSQPADLSRIVGILRDAGYRGWIALEYEAKEDPYTAIPRHVEALRAVLRD